MAEAFATMYRGTNIESKSLHARVGSKEAKHKKWSAQLQEQPVIKETGTKINNKNSDQESGNQDEQL